MSPQSDATTCHCEEHSDEAIPIESPHDWSCFAATLRATTPPPRLTLPVLPLY